MTFSSFFFRRLFWKRETILCAVHELINLIIIQFRVHGYDRGESLHWTLAAQTNKGNWDAATIRRYTYRYTYSFKVVMTLSVFFFFDRSFLISIPMIVLICLPQISMTIIPAFMWVQPPFSLCCGLVPLLTGKKYIFSYLLISKRRGVITQKP